MSTNTTDISTTPPTTTPTTTLPSTTPTTTTPTTTPPATTPTTTAPATTPTTTQAIPTSTVVAPTQPPTTQLVTSIVTASASNGQPQQPSTVVVTKISTPSPITSNNAGTQTSSTSASSSTNSALNAGQGKSSSNSGLSTAGKTAIAVVIPVVVVALLVFAGLFLWRRRNQRKAAEDERRKEMEAYGFNPNNDPTLPAVGGVAASALTEDDSGYRGWGTTASNRKASTTLSSGAAQLSDHGGYHSPGSPTQQTMSDHNSGDPLVHGHHRHSTMDSETIGALGAAPSAANNIRRGPSNASSSYSMGGHSTHSADAPIPVGAQDYYTDNMYYGVAGSPYDNTQGAGNEAVIRDNPARRNTRIERANVYPQQGSSGIAQNF